MIVMDERAQEGRLVRPYTMTGGRTGADIPMIALEALISATPDGYRSRSRYRWEAAEIIEICRKETAVIELAALLDVPIGVVRVLVADLSGRGAVMIIDPPTGLAADLDSLVYTNLLQKVLDGIKAL
jgi:Protein of unknown function (DUF742)